MTEIQGAISRSVPISALFTPGNILEGSYKEEFIDYGTNTEDVIVSAIYRDNERNGAFPRNNSVEVKLSDTAEDNAIRETIDMSAFVTRREQAILAAKFLCQTRRHSRRAIEFKTFPTDSFVAPGSFIYVELAQNQWNRIQTGIVGEGGSLNLALGESVRNGTYQVLLYNPTSLEQRTVYRETVSVAGGTASTLRNFKDHVFVLGRAIRSKRVFRVVEVAMDEEGEVQIKAVEHPCDANGLSLITRGLAEFVNRLFTIDGRREQA
jgi:predicted phage tail protein